MGVLNDQWWPVWWPWMLLWLVTAGSAVTVVALTIFDVRRRRGQSAGRNLTYSICFYLHNNAIMDQYQMGRYTAALSKEVEQRISTSGGGGIETVIPSVSVGAGRSREIVSKYLEEAAPISVIGIIMDVLERNDVIVHVDLVNGTVRRNAALTKSLATAPQGSGWATGSGRGSGSAASPQTVRLRDIEDFVLLRGRFRKLSEAPDSTVFLAPYGDPDDPGQGPRVRVSCATEGLRNKVPRGTFSARCLGKIQDWNAQDGVLEVEAIAIFL